MKKLSIILMIMIFTTCLAGVSIVSALEDDESHGGDIIYTMPVKSVLFSHKTHVEENEMDCDTCHEDIFQMEALAAQDEDDFTMEGLYEGKYCGACHEGSVAFSSDTQCARCHIGVKGYNAQQGLVNK